MTDPLALFDEMHGPDSDQEDPELWAQTARELHKRGDYLSAAVCYTIAADFEKVREVPRLDVINRWDMAASRSLENHDAAGEL